ncbi:hypothetical protein [Listeria sp. SHR_NRA_18]|uniref:hypothetical protein n=1 Tax=Listeria sp. SHR_NRA_18 TaxID=2269046 RepID=UPI0013751987|nr:hypothetical protein [Listeria sp. SHR_NRA_18]
MFSALVNFFFCGHEDEAGEIKLTKGTMRFITIFAGSVIFAVLLCISVLVMNYAG